MNKTIYLYILFTSLFISLITNAQTNKLSNKPELEGNTKLAKDNFFIGNYKDAITEYTLLLKTDSLNSIYNLNLGISYLFTNIDKSKAIYYLEKAITDPNVDSKAWYELGRAYLVNYRLDDAIKTFEAYKKIPLTTKVDLLISADRMIEMCEQAKINITKPINITFENMGSDINSPFPDYNPYVPADESFLVYTTRRKGTTGNFVDYDGYNTADVYISNQNYEKWSKTKSIGININTDLVEETVGLSTDGKKLFVSVDNYIAMNVIILSEIKGKTFQKPTVLMDNIVSKNVEKSATITSDKKTIIFSSDKNSKNEGMNLYMSKLLPNGEWGPAEDIPALNTKYDEDFPYFAPDGKTLYFSSQGYNSMGGYDIFKTIWNETDNSWSEPENLGYPLNTTDNDYTISFSASGRRAYISAFREDGYGDLDIYKVIFNDVDPSYTILSGTILNQDSVNIFNVKKLSENDTSNLSETILNIDSLNIDTLNMSTEINNNKFEEKNVKIIVKNLTSQNILGTYRPNKITGNFLIALPPGELEVTVIADGYSKYSENFSVVDKSNNSEINKDIVLLNKN